MTWTVKSVYHYSSKSFQLASVELTPANTTVTNIVATSDESSYPYDVNTPITGVQRVPGSATEATLAVKARWDDGYPERRRARPR